MGRDYERARGLFATSLELLNDLEEQAYNEPGLSGSVLSDWVAGIPLAVGADTYLRPEHAALGTAIEDLRRLSQRLGRLASLCGDWEQIHSGLREGPRARQ